MGVVYALIVVTVNVGDLMKYGFDIDGTLTIPAIAKLANDLYKAGYEIYIITGGLKTNEDPELEIRKKHRKNQLKNLIEGYTKLIICVGYTTQEVAKMKGEVCLQENIGIIFEDTPLYINWIRQITKGNTAVVSVV